jgi:hypothetical protein
MLKTTNTLQLSLYVTPSTAKVINAQNFITESKLLIFLLNLTTYFSKDCFNNNNNLTNTIYSQILITLLGSVHNGPTFDGNSAEIPYLPKYKMTPLQNLQFSVNIPMQNTYNYKVTIPFSWLWICKRSSSYILVNMVHDAVRLKSPAVHTKTTNHWKH